MKNWTRADVLADIAHRFPHEDAATILSLLDSYQKNEQYRVQLAILKLSEGSIDKLLHSIIAANTDYRDVIWWSEIE